MPEHNRTTDARIAISSETRERIRLLKRGGETYDEVLNQMADQYDPENVAREQPA